MSKTNRTHTPPFKAQVALAAIKGDRTISQIAAHFQIHVNLVAHWKKQLLQGAANIFAPAGKGLPPPDDAKQAELYEQIGRLQVELALPRRGGSLPNCSITSLWFNDLMFANGAANRKTGKRPRYGENDQRFTRYLETA